MLPYAGYVDPESTLTIGVHHDGHLEATERTFCSLYHTLMFPVHPFARFPVQCDNRSLFVWIFSSARSSVSRVARARTQACPQKKSAGSAAAQPQRAAGRSARRAAEHEKAPQNPRPRPCRRRRRRKRHRPLRRTSSARQSLHAKARAERCTRRQC